MAKQKTGELSDKKRFNFDDLELVLLSAPTVVWYALFCYLPFVGIFLAFKKYKLSPGKGFLGSLIDSEWCGLSNFEFLFARDDTMAILGRTLGYNFIFIILNIVVPVALAIMINNLYSKKLAKVTQTAMFLPYFMSWVVVGYFVYAFLAANTGLVPNMIRSMGGEPIDFYGKAGNSVWPYLIVFLNLWKGTGYNMVVYLASITGIDSTYYEAAVIDGATKWQQTMKITIPLLRQMMIIMGIMAVGRIFSSDFGLFYQSHRNANALYPTVQTLDVFVYNALMQLNNPAMAQAAALFQSVAGCITILAANAVVTKIDPDSAFF